jgi:Dehydrogenases (flavoproteins)
MKKIVVAGAGHGGIAAAGLLAKEGYSVEVYEKNSRENMGYDWTDVFDMNSLLSIGAEPPKNYVYKRPMTFINPSEDVRLKSEITEGSAEIKAERKAIYDSLINFAEKSGAKIFYGRDVSGPLVKGGKVAGIVAGAEIKADLVIDSAGIFSPVAAGLPESYGIKTRLEKGEVFYVWRAFYERTDGGEADGGHRVYIYHAGFPGVSWAAYEKEYIDVMIGRVEPIDGETVEKTLKILKNDNPAIGEKILRGGAFLKIPVRRPIPVFVGDFYAAVGDTARMTIPLIGSGIANSIYAGKYLAETVIAAGEKPLTADALWDYEVEYFMKRGAPNCKLDAIKNFLLSASKREVDLLFQKQILVKEDFGSASAGETPRLDLKNILGRIKRGLTSPVVLSRLGTTIFKANEAEKKALEISKIYDEGKIKKWIEKT